MKGADRPRRAVEVVSAAHEGAPGGLGESHRVVCDAGADAVEDLLATIVAAAIGVGEVRRDVAFSALGGDSLAATRVLSQTWQAFGVKLPLSALAPGVSVRELCEAVKCARADSRSRLPLQRGLAREMEELSTNQAAIWFNEAERSVEALYTIPHCLRLRGALDLAALQRSLRRLVSRHEALRFSFQAREGRIVQMPVTAASAFDLPILDLVGIRWEERNALALELANRHVRAPLELARPPLLRVTLMRLARDEHMLVLAVHHIVCDAWSIKLMMRELGADYCELANSEGSFIADTQSASCSRAPTQVEHTVSKRGIDELAPSFMDYLAWQRNAIGSAELTRIAADWRKVLGELSPRGALTTDYPRPGRPNGVGAVEPIELSAELTGKLRGFGAEHGVTLFMMLVCAFAVVLMGQGGAECVTIGAAVANRGEHLAEEIVGYLTNMVPLRVDGAGDPTLRELLRRVRSMALFAYDREALPFAQLVRALGPPRQAGLSPLFQTAVILNDVSASKWGDVEISEVTLHTGTAKLDITCYLEERGGGLSGYLEYATELFHPDTIRGLRTDLERVLMELPTKVDRQLSVILDLLTGA